MIIYTGVSGPSERKEKAYVRAAPLLGTAPCPGYLWECRQEARVLGLFGLRAAPASGRGRPYLEHVSFKSPPAPALAPPTPCGCAGSIATGSAGAGLRIRGSSWIFGVGGCNVARRNEKTASRRVLRKGWCSQHQTFEVTGSREPCYQNTSQVCVMKARVSSKIPSKPCYRWPLPLAICRTRSNWMHVDVVELGARVGLNGETLETA